jgi:hypothetical protein
MLAPTARIAKKAVNATISRKESQAIEPELA